MSRLLALGLVAVAVCAATAGSNPDVRIYIDFDPPNYVHDVWPDPFTTVDAYVCLDHAPGGVTCVCFATNNVVADYPEVFATQSFVPLFPGNLYISDPWWHTTVCSTDCMTEDYGPILVGYISLFYLGYGEPLPACIEILDHYDYPRWVVDCTEPGEVDYYCVLSNGSVNGGACLDGDCAPVPVASESWGAIKSMYR